MKAWIITIGNEILIGRIVNTNSAWLAKKLTTMGIEVRKMITIPDEEDDIIQAFREAIRHADLVISTGGLGPTFDDKTSEALAKALNRRWVINPKAYKEVKRKFEAANMELTEARLKMAKMPEGSIPLSNSAGTAPGILIEINGKLIVALPGVPREMKAIFEENLEKILAKKAPHKYYAEKSIGVVGIPESAFAPYIDKVMKKYPKIYIKSHPRGHETKGPVLEIHITTYAETEDEARKLVEDAAKELMEKVNELGGGITHQ
jgi:molybdenum cofactor synthesis domain-containing protein